MHTSHAHPGGEARCLWRARAEIRARAAAWKPMLVATMVGVRAVIR
jgi:hypothetical protein